VWRQKSISMCEHSRIEEVLQECGGNSAILNIAGKENNLRSLSSSLCEHSRAKEYRYKEVWRNLCEHSRLRSMESGGSGLCEHKIQSSYRAEGSSHL
jgi:hypothetical protein